MDTIRQDSASCWRTRLKQCMDKKGLTQMELVSALNRQYLTKFHQKDVSRWLNTGNHTASGTIGFPKYETMTIIADFFGVNVGYLTGETDEQTFDMAHTCQYTGLNNEAIQAIREWNGLDSTANCTLTTIQSIQHSDTPADNYRSHTLNALLSSEHFPNLAAKLLTLYEMSSIWQSAPERFNALMASLASESDFSDDLTFQLIVGAFYGMTNESFSALLRDAYPIPTQKEFIASKQ